ncbi:hypothetical protein H5410_030744, partial [Solanum commersonii]
EHKASTKVQQILQVVPAVIMWKLWKRRNSYKHGNEASYTNLYYQFSRFHSNTAIITEQKMIFQHFHQLPSLGKKILSIDKHQGSTVILYTIKKRYRDQQKARVNEPYLKSKRASSREIEMKKHGSNLGYSNLASTGQHKGLEAQTGQEKMMNLKSTYTVLQS